jgi:adenosylhomocysteine nucleosidase
MATGSSYHARLITWMLMMETIGIIAAMPQERQAVLRLVGKRQHSRLDLFRCDFFRLAGRECWLLTSGMGHKRAAQAARVLLEATRPQLLASVGVAGAIHADLQIGDVVVARDVCQLDQGVPGSFQPLALLSKAAWQAAEQALQARRAHLYLGTAVTTPGSQFIAPTPRDMTNPVLEMETAGIAGVAAESGLPLLCLRGISDGPRAPIPFDLEKAMDKDYNLRMGEILKTLLGRPQILPQLLRVGRNARLAAGNAASALVAVLSLAEALVWQG